MIRMILAVCAVICFAAPAATESLRDPRCNTSARYDAMREGADCSGPEARSPSLRHAPVADDWAGNDMPVTGCHTYNYHDLMDCPPPPVGRRIPNWLDVHELQAAHRIAAPADKFRDRSHAGDEWCSRHPADCRWSSHVPTMPGRCVGRRPDCIFDGEKWR